MSDNTVVKGSANIHERRVAASRLSVAQLKGMLRMIGTKPNSKWKKNKLVELIVNSGSDIPIKNSRTNEASDKENTAIDSSCESDGEDEKEYKYDENKNIHISDKIGINKIDNELRVMLAELVREQVSTAIASNNAGKSVQSVPVAPDHAHNLDAARAHMDRTRSILRPPAESNNTARFASNTYNTQVHNNGTNKGAKTKVNKGIGDVEKAVVWNKLTGHIGGVNNNKDTDGNNIDDEGDANKDIDGDMDRDMVIYDDNDFDMGDDRDNNNVDKIERASSSLQHRRLARDIIERCRQSCGSVEKWVERYEWKDKRKYYECIAIAQALDAFIHIGVKAEEEGMEILARRLAGMQLVDETGKWEMVKALDRSTHTLLNHQQLHLVDKVASVFKKLHTPVRDSSYTTTTTGYQRGASTFQRGKSNTFRGRGGRGRGYNKGGYNNNNNGSSNADGAANNNRVVANENGTAQRSI